MYEQILKKLLDRYGHLSYPELTAALRKDGLGEFVDAIENNPDIMRLISEFSRKLPTDLLGDIGTGTMPSTSQQIRGIPVDYYETISFDHKACLEKCAGNCIANKMIIMYNRSS